MIKAEEHAEFSRHDQSGLVRLLIAARCQAKLCPLSYFYFGSIPFVYIINFLFSFILLKMAYSFLELYNYRVIALTILRYDRGALLMDNA